MAVSKISIRRDFKQAGTGYNNSKKAKKEKLNLYWLNSNLDQDKPGRTPRAGYKNFNSKMCKNFGFRTYPRECHYQMFNLQNYTYAIHT